MGLGFGSVEDLPVEEGGGVARHHELVRVRVRVGVSVGVRVRARVRVRVRVRVSPNHVGRLDVAVVEGVRLGRELARVRVRVRVRVSGLG